MGGETSARIESSSYPKLSQGPVGQQIESIYTDRLRAFTSTGQYEKQYLLGYATPLNQTNHPTDFI